MLITTVGAFVERCSGFGLDDVVNVRWRGARPLLGAVWRLRVELRKLLEAGELAAGDRLEVDCGAPHGRRRVDGS